MPITRLQARKSVSQLRLTTQEDDTPPTSPEADETPTLPPTPRLRHVELPRPRVSSAPVLTAATRRRLSDTSEFSPLQTPPPSPPPGLRVVSAPLPRGSPETNPEFHQLMWRAKQELACTPHDPSPLRKANTPISSPQTSSGGSRGSSSPVMIETSEILCRGEEAVESLVPELGSDNEEEWIEDVSTGNFGPQKWVHLLRPPRSHSKKDRRRTALIEASDRPVGSPEYGFSAEGFSKLRRRPSLSPEQASELHEALSESDMRKCSVALFRPTASEATSTSAKRSTVKYPRRSVSLS